MKNFLFVFLLVGCVGAGWIAPPEFQYVPIKTDSFEIATWQKINNPKSNQIHIYIEGDGYAYDAYGQPTANPTPRGTFVRDLIARDDFENVVYIARPCQFIMDEICKESDWTNARFSQQVIDAEKDVIKKIADNKHIVLVGYSGGAMVSGLIIKQNPNMKIDKWITIAGVLNHKKWTQYFGDAPLDKSLDLETLPEISQTHFVGGHDNIVPYALAKTWAKDKDIVLIESATHDDFGNLKIER